MHLRARRNIAATSLTLALALSLSPFSARAGDLDPPAGPVAPTFKTLHEVEPRIPLANDPNSVAPIVISQRGSYYLTENIFGLPGEHAIEILSDDVTLDLRGFAVIGNFEVPPIDGIHAANRTNIAVLNGVVRDFPGIGVNISGGRSAVVEGVRVDRCLSGGISAGFGASVSRCTATRSGGGGMFGSGDGISASHGSAITNCSAYENTADGFSVGLGASITNCSAYDNVGDGFNTGNGVSLTSCSAYSNGGYGFNTPQHSSLTACTAHDNILSGFRSIFGCSYLNCVSNENDTWGFEVEDGLIRGCLARQNSTANTNLISTVVFESDMP